MANLKSVVSKNMDIIGGLWAERIRKTIGLSVLLGRLIGMRELRYSDKNS